MDDAERERALAIAVNGAAVGMLGVLCASRRISVAHFSTDYVFPGTGSVPYDEDAAAWPVNAYGASKHAGEYVLQASRARALIVRTQWLFGAGGRSFPRTMWERATRGQPTRVVNDQWGRPTYTVDLARATWQLIEGGVEGIFHVANAGEATWFDVASLIFAETGRPYLVTRCTTKEYPTQACRPGYGVLSTAKVERFLSAGLPAWENGIARLLTLLRPN
ncbi:MAG: dTDP-4-dehydrorhamnose reductase [Gemmatimonadaceae bacterium]